MRLRLRFRKVRKIKEVDDRKTEQKEYGFQKIKPESDITFEEAQAFWNDFFNKMSKEES